MYLGTKGKSADNKNFTDVPVIRDFPIVNEFSEKELSDPSHQPKLAKALQEAEEFLKSGQIGAVLIETIFSNPGIGALHPDFVMGLRELCDKFGTPLVVDEIMTGGGRTGKFFAFEHYPGFEPDFITFGKGMQVAGIARQQRSSGMLPISGPRDGTTVGSQLEPLLKGAQVLNRIHQDGLVQNAADVGQYLIDSVRQARPNSRVHGFGLIIKEVPGVKGVEAAYGRWLPPLTLTRENVDTIVSRMENK
jgi:4-aminobutyrate aminotransferase-like enzyme